MSRTLRIAKGNLEMKMILKRIRKIQTIPKKRTNRALKILRIKRSLIRNPQQQARPKATCPRLMENQERNEQGASSVNTQTLAASPPNIAAGPSVGLRKTGNHSPQ